MNPQNGLPFIPLKAYTVPIRKKNGNLAINWDLIEKVIDYVRHRLYEVKCLSTDRNIVLFKYDLEENVRKAIVPKKKVN